MTCAWGAYAWRLALCRRRATLEHPREVQVGGRTGAESATRRGMGREARSGMNRVRVVFFGSADSVFSDRHFRALEGTGAEIAAVVDVPRARRASTNAALPGGRTFMDAATGRGIPALEPENPNDPGVVNTLRALSPDLFIAVGYLLLLRPALLAVPRLLAANFHASLLPAYRGKHPVFWALRNGERWCGLTVHEMSPGLDTGDIIFNVRVRTRADDTVGDLYDRIMAKSVGLVPLLVRCAEKGRFPRRPQPARGASYFGATKDADFRLDLSRDAKSLARWVRITPGKCYIETDLGRIFVQSAHAVARAPGGGHTDARTPGAGDLAFMTHRPAQKGERAFATGRGTLIVRPVESKGDT
jgi:methionyl-tRNA formyltransferase